MILKPNAMRFVKSSAVIAFTAIGYKALMYLPAPYTAVIGDNMVSAAVLGISPYLCASLIMYFLAAFINSLSDMRKGGDTGKRKFSEYTFILTAFISVLTSVWFVCTNADSFAFGTLFQAFVTMAVIAVVPCAIGAVISFIGEGSYGDGLSLFLMMNIASSFTGQIRQITNFGKQALIISSAGYLMLFLIIIAVSYCRLNVSLSYSGKKPSANDDKDFLSLRFLSNGIMPVIFASGIIGVIYSVSNKNAFFGAFEIKGWFHGNVIQTIAGIFIYFILAYISSKLMRHISFNASDVAENLRRNGCVITNVRQEQTALYLKKQFFIIDIIDSIIFVFVTAVPVIFSRLAGTDVILSGSLTILTVSVLRQFSMALKADKRKFYYEKMMSDMRTKQPFALFMKG